MSVPTYVSARAFRPQPVETTGGQTWTASQLFGPVHAARTHDDCTDPDCTDEGCLHSLCGVPVIVDLPPTWPRPAHPAVICPRCRALAREETRRGP